MQKPELLMDLIEQQKIENAKFIRHPWETVRFKVLCSFLKKIKKKNFILDIGSGDAFVAKELSQKLSSVNIAAVDINYNDEFIIRNQRDNLCFFKSLNDLQTTENIDVVLLMDVLEHIEKPEALLNEVKKLRGISTSTQFIITVPAFQILFTQHDVFLKHFKRYNRTQLLQLMQQQNFAIDESGYFFFSLLPTRTVQKIFRLKTKQGPHNWKGSRFTTSFLTAVLWLDFKFSWLLSRIGISLPGLSCYCICHLSPS